MYFFAPSTRQDKTIRIAAGFSGSWYKNAN
jgi:hypothetical protein